MKKAVFVDKHGLLNSLEMDTGNIPRIPLSMDVFRIIEEHIAPVKMLRDVGFLVIALCHEPGISRGYQSKGELNKMHELVRRKFPLDDIMVCIHDEKDHCPCRVPRPGLLIEAAFKWHINLEQSYSICDNSRTVEAARTAGTTPVVVDRPYNADVNVEFRFKTFETAVEKVIELSRM